LSFVDDALESRPLIALLTLVVTAVLMLSTIVVAVKRELASALLTDT